jgi:Fe-S oxidoreductase
MRNGYLDFALWTANERIKEAKSTGVHALVTYCPHCEENLGDAVKNSNEKIEILNLLDLVLEAIC